MADRGAGSHTAGADYDFCFALSPHEAEGKSALSTSCHDRSSPPDLTVRMTIAHGLDVDDMENCAN